MGLAHAVAQHGTLLDQCVLVVLTSPRQYHPPHSHCIGWFTSLSKLFLGARTARLLVLAGTERLDRELMIGQMQGKFQLSVISGVGHMLQEVRLSIWTSVRSLTDTTVAPGQSEKASGSPCRVLEEERARYSWRQEGRGALSHVSCEGGITWRSKKHIYKATVSSHQSSLLVHIDLGCILLSVRALVSAPIVCLSLPLSSLTNVSLAEEHVCLVVWDQRRRHPHRRWDGAGVAGELDVVRDDDMGQYRLQNHSGEETTRATRNISTSRHINYSQRSAYHACRPCPKIKKWSSVLAELSFDAPPFPAYRRGSKTVGSA